ncbi:MAG: efflux RND transporter periplasmic adaptor subunit [Verrucomicrobiae bacterium]|nr:efflux RND transporter periplasmic adaptor subunit [Verrucomicrobiae bacterium]
MKFTTGILALAACGLAAGFSPASEIEGTVLPFKTVTVSSPVEEIITSIPVEEGDTIGKGDILAELRNEQETLELERYDKLLKRAKFEAEADQRLFENGSGTESEAIESRTELDRLESEQDLVKLRLKEKTILSPISGIVVDKMLEAGESVERIEDMFEIIDIEKVFVRFYLDARYLKTLEAKQEFSVRVPLLGEDAISAKVDFIDSRIDPASGLVEVKLLAENPEKRIKAGMRALLTMPDPEGAN